MRVPRIEDNRMFKVVSHGLVALLVLMVAGCGGDGDSAKDAGKDSSKDGKANTGAGAGTVKVSPLSTLPEEKRL